eukprot:319245-Hanusia_phi.AAC.1
MLVGPTLYFVSYLVIVAFTLLPVVIAVLLDNFTTATRKEKDKVAREALALSVDTQESNSMDPLLSSFVSITSDAEFEGKVRDLFARLDDDNSERLNYQ